jgi:hypothetical protein
MVYDLPVEEEKVKLHQVTALHLVCAFAFIGTGVIIAVYNYTIPMYGGALLVAGIVLLGLTILKNKWLTGRKVNFICRILEVLIAAWVAIYSAVQHWKFPEGIFAAISLAVLFAMYWEQATSGKLSILVGDDGVKLPVTSRKRFIPWTEIEQVSLRFGTLSIECIDDRLFQYSLSIPNSDDEVFEAWCVARVDENKSKRIVDDW